MTDKFISPCKPPEGLERELIECLAEECNEVAQRCMKALRFGVQEVQPGQELTNIERIAQEFGDVMCVFRHIEELGMANWRQVMQFADEKQPKLNRFLQNKFPANKRPSSTGEEK